MFSSMAQKESSHKEVVDDLTGQLTQVRKQYEDLHALSRDQVRHMPLDQSSRMKLTIR